MRRLRLHLGMLKRLTVNPSFLDLDRIRDLLVIYVTDEFVNTGVKVIGVKFGSSRRCTGHRCITYVVSIVKGLVSYQITDSESSKFYKYRKKFMTIKILT